MQNSNVPDILFKKYFKWQTFRIDRRIRIIIIDNHKNI